MALGIVVIGSFLISTREIAISSWFIAHHEVQMVDSIQAGIALLKASPPLEYGNGRQQTALAILDKTTGKLSEERIWITPSGELLSGTLPIKIKWWNVFNSVYEIENRPELVVVANKFLIERVYLPEQQTLQLVRDAPQSRYTDMVYAPYSEFIHAPDVVAAGKTYLNERANAALKELRVGGVSSRAIPGKLVVDVVPEDLIKMIVLVEHVDPGWLQLADDGGRALAERALVIIGANREWAYRYTNSKADAYGLAQFIEPTYDLMVQRYPEAHLIKDHTLGMADHVNAFKAIALLFDNEMNEIQSKTGLPATPDMLAAAYNGGPSRVISALKHDGLEWQISPSLAHETRDYVAKYHLIAKLGIF